MVASQQILFVPIFLAMVVSARPSCSGVEQFRYVNATTLIRNGMKRLELASPSPNGKQQKVDPSAVKLTYTRALYLKPPNCRLASLDDNFDFANLIDLQGDQGWVHHDITTKKRNVTTSTTSWNYETDNDSSDLKNDDHAVVFVPKPVPRLQSVPIVLHQPGAYYWCCYELNTNHLMGQNFDLVRGIMAEQFVLQDQQPGPPTATNSPTERTTKRPTHSPSTNTPTTSKPTSTPTQKPTDKPTQKTDLPTTHPTTTPQMSIPTNSPSQSGPLCFETTPELRRAAIDYNEPDLKKDVVNRYGPIANWCVSKVVNFRNIFGGLRSFNEGLEGWDVSNAVSMDNMFQDAIAFNQPLNDWNVSKVRDMSRMFQNAVAFNQPLDNWDVSLSGPGAAYLFYLARSFNQPLDHWDVSGARVMERMFTGCSAFNQPLNSWNVGRVFKMNFMFAGASEFNQPLNNWNVSLVNDMSYMFSGAEKFNNRIDNWDVSRVRDMHTTFNRAYAFNQNLDSWNVSSLIDMSYTFGFASSFNQNLCSWGPKMAATKDSGQTVTIIIPFGQSGCPTERTPDLDASPPGPYCYFCS